MGRGDIRDMKWIKEFWDVAGKAMVIYLSVLASILLLSHLMGYVV